MNALIDKKDFIGLERCSWFYSGAETPTHRGVLQAVTDYLHARSLGPVGRERNAATEERCKRNLALLLGGQPEHIALMSNASEAISMIAQALPFRPGDNVVLHVLEFPSGVLPWLALQSQGVEVRVVPHRDWQIDEADLLGRIDSRTRLVVTSHVSYLTGIRFDYRRLYEHVRQTDALLLLDATQSLGVVPVDMMMADLVVSSSYKWLLSIHGGAVLAVNPQRTAHLAPRYVGWRSVKAAASGEAKFQAFEFQPDARRFELGYPAYSTVYALESSTRLLLEVGIDSIERHVAALGDVLIPFLSGLGLEVTTPSEAGRRAGNISFRHDDAEAVAARLQERSIYVMGGDGRVRISVHAFNDSGDIGQLMQHLPDCL
ncbi:Selenocysteine lyase/Cysteine desulfurase [Paenibacillus sp. UNCCL117]|uniref:aminotransferase class V-fold PLP-dependent enzyme n=1 Tax=unclassified Paenibacillus TaxID=185978 RepID=UPI0008911151|nr:MULTISPECIES: aminotransferase class V-fold PLP-dependent enzyme [unclassified Paenibacillus]SDE10343.1 Selenocysteine lyase/Cysteine desulfurase [Paenibacillus sp. cl123]SFW59743.1 Selenocysteine lyase/Cysteine desulfurase [Paenibacillus sp. UNCCL117]